MKKIVIIGLGLIGSSLALSIKKHKLCKTVSGYDVNCTNLKWASTCRIVDENYSAIELAISNVDLIVIATPVNACIKVLSQIAPLLNKHQVITDTGSTKFKITTMAEKLLKEKFKQFVPGHPLIGLERSGIKAAVEDLFFGQHVILTPAKDTDSKALQTVTTFWEKLHSIVDVMTPAQHDKIIAFTSHLPHILSFVLANTQNTKEIMISPRSLTDLLRIAKSNPRIWHDIFLTNTKNILHSIDKFEKNLQKIKKAIESKNSSAILSFIKSANKKSFHILSGKDVQNTLKQ
jgi:prephenate dehydrogenase